MKIKLIVLLVLTLFSTSINANEKLGTGNANAICSPQEELHAYFVIFKTGQKYLLKLKTVDPKGKVSVMKYQPKGTLKA